MLVFSKKERSWQSNYAKRKVASHPSPFLEFRRSICTTPLMTSADYPSFYLSWFYLNPLGRRWDSNPLLAPQCDVAVPTSHVRPFSRKTI